MQHSHFGRETTNARLKPITGAALNLADDKLKKTDLKTLKTILTATGSGHRPIDENTVIRRR